MLSLPISLHLLRLNQNLIWGYSSSKEEWEINYILFFISSWKDSIHNGHPWVCPRVHVSTCFLGDAPALCFDTWRYLACIVLCMLWVKDLIFFFFRWGELFFLPSFNEPLIFLHWFFNDFFFCVSFVGSPLPLPVLYYLNSPYLVLQENIDSSSLYILKPVR